jgi:hypothetical protein
MSRRPSRRAIAEQDEYSIERQRMFRIAADAVAAALAHFDEVEAVALFGSVAVPLWREVPRFSGYRRSHIEVWHECKDVDLAVWIGRLGRLRELERASAKALASLWTERNLGIAHHQADIFLFEPGSDRYLGRLCHYATCPNGKPDCLVPGCGREPFLKQHEDFVFHHEVSLAEARIIRLYDKRQGILRRAENVPVVGVDT